MSEQTNHTPGPWIHTDAFIGTAGDDPQTIAYVSDHRNKVRRIKEETEANARLIAAAPDLLEACEAALPLVAEDYDGPMRQWEWQEIAGITKQLRAAIAKAHGEEQAQ